MIRNGYVLPSYKQAICTLDFMLRVRAGEVWVPRGNECRAIKVATPPPRQQLAEIFSTSVDLKVQNGNFTAQQVQPLFALREIVVKKLADSNWLIQVIYFLNPDHDIFQKEFFYEKPKKERAFNNMPMINNDDGFWDNLPAAAKLGSKKNGPRFLRLTKNERKQMKLQALELRKRELEDRMAQLRNELADGEDVAAEEEDDEESKVNATQDNQDMLDDQQDDQEEQEA